MISQIGLRMIDRMIGGNEIDCLGCGMDDNDTVDFCGSCDILHNEMGSLFSK